MLLALEITMHNTHGEGQDGCIVDDEIHFFFSLILMTDDLLPLLAYCSVHAADISVTCSYATFAKKMGLSPTNGATGLACPARMQNFVDRFQEMDGKFAYYATTLQIAAQWVISIKEPADLPVPPNATANKDGETEAEVPPLSTVEEQQ